MVVFLQRPIDSARIEFEIKPPTGSIFMIGGVMPLVGHDGLVQKK